MKKFNYNRTIKYLKILKDIGFEKFNGSKFEKDLSNEIPEQNYGYNYIKLYCNIRNDKSDWLIKLKDKAKEIIHNSEDIDTSFDIKVIIIEHIDNTIRFHYSFLPFFDLRIIVLNERDFNAIFLRKIKLDILKNI